MAKSFSNLRDEPWSQSWTAVSESKLLQMKPSNIRYWLLLVLFLKQRRWRMFKCSGLKLWLVIQNVRFIVLRKRMAWHRDKENEYLWFVHKQGLSTNKGCPQGIPCTVHERKKIEDHRSRIWKITKINKFDENKFANGYVKTPHFKSHT